MVLFKISVKMLLSFFLLIFKSLVTGALKFLKLKSVWDGFDDIDDDTRLFVVCVQFRIKLHCKISSKVQYMWLSL